jgi:uroporphyrin-III C-methyltransferase
MSETVIQPGSVWLVGAGPGDPDLLTRKAEKLIQAASIIFYDALVGEGVLELAPQSAKLVPVGKRSGRHSKDQRSINELLVDAALTGERVVRLKGGDVGIFGRAAEEVDALAEHGIAVHICPGITAASAAAASAGISLTLRGLARKLVFVTAHARRERSLISTGARSQIQRRRSPSTWARRQRRSFHASWLKPACLQIHRFFWWKTPVCQRNASSAHGWICWHCQPNLPWETAPP